ncbi:MAG TPA: hypothetical protein VK176_06285, partial [Phycisphaerales bacterium]|nr:hypothetical protein [Phycisphaerales bacterium]
MHTMMCWKIRVLALAAALCASVLASTAMGQGSKADYARSAGLGEIFRGKVSNTTVRPEWLDQDRFWYRTNLAEGKRAFWLVDAAKGERTALFDHAKVAEQLSTLIGTPIAADHLPIERLDAGEDGKILLMLLRDDGRLWALDRTSGVVTERPATEGTPFHLAAY